MCICCKDHRAQKSNRTFSFIPWCWGDNSWSAGPTRGRLHLLAPDVGSKGGLVSGLKRGHPA